MKRCAIYARYSSDLQSPSSIDDQLALCRAHADGQGWTVVATYQDAALSGFGVEHRPEYQRLLATLSTRPLPFDLILVEDLSRITRDMSELMRLYHQLRLAGVELVGVKDGMRSGTQGAKVHFAVRGLVNELYLDDLREKTHRGLAGRVARGLSAGGRIFGYRTVRVETEGVRPGKHTAPARYEIEPREAAVLRRIFREYADGRSMKTIAHALNAEGVPFPAKDTKRRPARRGWALSTIHVILRNEKYRGIWVWNKTRFLKDPATGKRRPMLRPPQEWVRHEYPELQIVEPNLWAAVQARLTVLGERFGSGHGQQPRGAIRAAYSPYLLSGLLRCGLCGARMTAQTATRRKGNTVFRYGWYRCSFAAAKGPAVCRHATWYRQDRLEKALAEKFRDAMSPGVIAGVIQTVNEQLEAAFQEESGRAASLQAEIATLEQRAKNLVSFLADGGEFGTVRAELREIEPKLDTLRARLGELARHPSAAAPRVHPTWVQAKLRELDRLLHRDPVRAKVEIAKHLDGDLTVSPLPSPAGERRAEIAGKIKQNSLLQEQEAVRLLLVAGAGFEPATFGL
jgi:site-specific DNA recombinase